MRKPQGIPLQPAPDLQTRRCAREEGPARQFFSTKRTRLEFWAQSHCRGRCSRRASGSPSALPPGALGPCERDEGVAMRLDFDEDMTQSEGPRTGRPYMRTHLASRQVETRLARCLQRSHRVLEVLNSNTSTDGFRVRFAVSLGQISDLRKFHFWIIISSLHSRTQGLLRV